MRYNDGSSPDLTINATSLSTGTIPEGSTWRRNPIPGCNCDVGGGCQVGGSGYSKAYGNNPDPISQGACPTGTMFPAQVKDGGYRYLPSPVHSSQPIMQPTWYQKHASPMHEASAVQLPGIELRGRGKFIAPCPAASATVAAMRGARSILLLCSGRRRAERPFRGDAKLSCRLV